MKILLGDFNAKVGRENIFKLTIGNDSLHQDSNDNGVRIVNFATSKNSAESKEPAAQRFVLYCIVFIERSSDPYKANTHRILSLSYTRIMQSKR